MKDESRTRSRSILARLLRRAGRRDPALQLPPMSRSMQRFSLLIVFLLGIMVTWLVMRGTQKRVDDALDAQPVAAPEAAETLYRCSMHPEVMERAPGQCPLCDMELQPVRADAAQGPGEREVLYWYAPMDPTYVRSEPGTSPMGMPLVPRYAGQGETGGATGVVRIDPVQVQNIGVVSVPVRRGDLSRNIRTVGILDFDANGITWANVKFSGWIEKVHVNYVGEHVHLGDPLFEIYSPELVTTQEEYLRALEFRDSLRGSKRPETLRRAESLLEATRDRLVYWDISEEQIRSLESGRVAQRRITIVSPGNGLVVEVADEALEGMFVEPGVNLYRIADLSSVWVHADIYERDMPWIYVGQKATVSLAYDLERTYESEVLFLYPEVSQETRTVKICIEIPNPEWRMRPGMYADVVLRGQTVRDAILVPRSSILRSGERDLVFVDLGEGRFAPRRVRLGVSGEGDLVQILEGLSAGEAVVTQAQFMLDSESRVQEAIAKFLERTTAERAQPGEGDRR